VHDFFNFTAMETPLGHLPVEKQEQILQAVEVIKEVSPAKIMLFGSFARGTQQQGWSHDGNAVMDFNSDFDILVVLKDGEERKEVNIYDKITNKFRSLGTPVSPMVHSIDQINRSLERGLYFFSEIIREGILLYDSGEFEFAQPRELTALEKQEIAQEYFDFWYPLANDFLETAITSFYKVKGSGKRLNYAIYNLFQATEGLYSTVLLVFTGYKPKTHNLEKLRAYSKGLSSEFDAVFPIHPKDRYDEDLFELLKRSYIGAKYKMDFQITERELSDLIKRVEQMNKLVEQICKLKITSWGKEN
jgi:predicted nucleotidyltransferase/HEPN domain-containing protein